MKLSLADRLSVTALFCILMCSGCYTLLKHPVIENQPETMDFNRCSECHTNFHETGFFEPIYDDPWWDYYALPWWYDDVIIVTDEGEIPYRQIIHDKNLRYREEQGMGIVPGTTLPPPKGDKKRDREDLKAETGDEEKVKKVPERDKTITRSEQLKKKKKVTDKTDRKRREDKDRDKE